MPTLIVEDGSCPEGANTYASLAAANAYCLDRGLWAETEDNTAKESALIRATDWLNSMDWRGTKVDLLRVMAFPRDSVIIGDKVLLDNNTVPAAIVVACIEAAAIYYSGADPMSAQEHGGDVAAYSESVGSLSMSTTYKDGAPAETLYRSVTGRIKLFLRSVEGASGGMKFSTLARG